jgi:hypothetical protein
VGLRYKFTSSWGASREHVLDYRGCVVKNTSYIDCNRPLSKGNE